MTTIAPSPELASLVRSFTIVETDAEVTRTLVPEPGALLGIRYGGAASLIEHGKATVLPDVTLTGMRNTVRRMRTSAGGGVIVTSFHEDAPGVLFGVPMRLLFNEVIGAGDERAAAPERPHAAVSDIEPSCVRERRSSAAGQDTERCDKTLHERPLLRTRAPRHEAPRRLW